MQAMSKCVSESVGVLVPLYLYVCVCVWVLYKKDIKFH